MLQNSLFKPVFLILYLITVHINNDKVCNVHWDNRQGIYDDNNKIHGTMRENQYLIY